MASENSFASLLEDSFSDNNEDVANYSSKLKDVLESQRFDSEILQQVLQDSLSSCPENLLDEKVFRESLPVAYRLLFEALKKIVETTSSIEEHDAMENVKKQLLICQELLIVWEKCTQRVSKLEKTSSINLKSLLESVPATLKLIFEHCRASQKLYGSLFEGISEKLTGLFRKAKTILNLFLTTLDGVIVFDTDTESETELLVKVIDGIGSLITIAQELDLKTYVETSKTFGKLAIVYQHDVKRVESSSVILHLEQMTKDVSSMLSLLQASLDKVDEKRVKVIGHSLKILDRLFAAYCSCITYETLSCAIELLLQMHRCSPSCLQKSQIDDKLAELINGHISRGTEPVLNTVFSISDFKQAFFDYENERDVDKVGYHLLTINVMKKLVGVPYEQHCKWTLGAESIIDIALKNINNMQEEICAGEIRLPGAHEIGERPRQASLYEATLLPICGLVSHVPADGFCAIELILLKHLLSNQLWSSLLSSDVWCFIGRISSSELCASHVKYLLKVYTALLKRYNSLEVVMLENLIGRLYSLLDEERKHSLVTELEDLENPSWIPIARFLPSKTRSFLQNRLTCVFNEIPQTFSDLQRQPTVQNWDRITTLLSLIGKLNYTGEKNTIETLSQIWNFIASTIEIFEGRQLDILSEFLWRLFNATQPDKIQDDTFFTILEAMLSSYLCFPPHARALAAHYLRNTVNSFESCNLKTANLLAELNCRLLEDENPWVRQEALESFDHVAHMCPNEDLVTKMATAITRKSSLSDSLPAYLSGTSFYELRDFTNLQHYLRYVTNSSRCIRHDCYRYEETPRDEKFAKLESQSEDSSAEDPLSIDLDERVNNLCNDLNDILKKNHEIGSSALRRLRSVCAKIVNLTESSK